MQYTDLGKDSMIMPDKLRNTDIGKQIGEALGCHGAVARFTSQLGYS